MFESWPLMLKQGVFCQWHSHVRHLLRVTYWHSYDYYAGLVERWGMVEIRPNHLLAATLNPIENSKAVCTKAPCYFSVGYLRPCTKSNPGGRFQQRLWFIVLFRNLQKILTGTLLWDDNTDLGCSLDYTTVTNPKASSRHARPEVYLSVSGKARSNKQLYSNQRGQIMSTI